MHWDTAKFQVLSKLTYFLIAHWHFMKNANKLWTKAILERKRSCLTKNNAYKKEKKTFLDYKRIWIFTQSWIFLLINHWFINLLIQKNSLFFSFSTKSFETIVFQINVNCFLSKCVFFAKSFNCFQRKRKLDFKLGKLVYLFTDFS